MLFAENSETVILNFGVKTVEMFLISGDVVSVKSSKYSLRTRIMRTFTDTNVEAVLLFGAEMWRATVADRNILNAFYGTCMRKIPRAFWQNQISNEERCEDAWDE